MKNTKEVVFNYHNNGGYAWQVLSEQGKDDNVIEHDLDPRQADSFLRMLRNTMTETSFRIEFHGGSRVQIYTFTAKRG